MDKTIEFDQECQSCRGTGLYSGMAESKDTAIVCHTCRGTGKSHFKHTYNEFTGRKGMNGIKRVYQYNPGIGIGENDKLNLKDFGGMSHEDWDSGKLFSRGSEMRKFVCPAWWYQGVNYDLKPNWEECLGVGAFSGCKQFKQREFCWIKFDNKNKP